MNNNKVYCCCVDHNVQCLATCTVKPVYKGHSREPENVPFISS